MTDREFEMAVPAIRPSATRMALAALLIGLLVLFASFLALAIHAYFAAPPTFR